MLKKPPTFLFVRSDWSSENNNLLKLKKKGNKPTGCKGPPFFLNSFLENSDWLWSTLKGWKLFQRPLNTYSLILPISFALLTRVSAINSWRVFFPRLLSACSLGVSSALMQRIFISRACKSVGYTASARRERLLISGDGSIGLEEFRLDCVSRMAYPSIEVLDNSFKAIAEGGTLTLQRYTEFHTLVRNLFQKSLKLN